VTAVRQDQADNERQDRSKEREEPFVPAPSSSAEKPNPRLDSGDIGGSQIGALRARLLSCLRPRWCEPERAHLGRLPSVALGAGSPAPRGVWVR
jgi:hypothetical protein